MLYKLRLKPFREQKFMLSFLILRNCYRVNPMSNGQQSQSDYGRKDITTGALGGRVLTLKLLCTV